MYSPDRRKALEITLSFLKEMDLYDQCQKTLVVDGETNWIPQGWGLVRVPRVDGKFCWARMWEAGVGTARYEQVVYLDSDRILPKNYLTKVQQLAQNNVFAFTSNHFMLLKEFPFETCKRILYGIGKESIFTDKDFMGGIGFDPRHKNPVHGPGKNVMSGSVAFTKSTFWRLGGVDHWYCGHGAFADTDFHITAAQGGCFFVDLAIPELHYVHPKLENSKSLSKEKLDKLSLENFAYYCQKWNLPVSLLEDMAYKSGIPKSFIKSISKVS